MAKCLKCNRQSELIGAQCSCGSYMVSDDCVEDSLHILGKIVANKFVPTQVIMETPFSVTYDIYQPVVDRSLSMYVLKPMFMKRVEHVEKFKQVTELYASIHQQNVLTVFGIQELPSIDTMAVILEAKRGEQFSKIYDRHAPMDPVVLMHIFHQVLQGLSACHLKSLTFPDFMLHNIWVMRSGGDMSSVKLFGIFDANLGYVNKVHSMLDDVYQIGQLALSCMTGQEMPITQIELPEDRAFLMPVAQVFMRAIAEPDQRYQSCVELLYAFESVFDLNTRTSDLSPVLLPDASTPGRIENAYAPVTLDQLVWMHRAPQRER